VALSGAVGTYMAARQHFRVRLRLAAGCAVAALGLLAVASWPTAAYGSAVAGRENSRVRQVSSSQPRAVAGWILRISKGSRKGYLRLPQMTAPDAASLNPPYPRCMLKHRPGRRVVNFDLNWSDINVRVGAPTPAVRLTILGPRGEQMAAVVPVDEGNRQVCRAVRSFQLGVVGRGVQLVLGLVMRVPVHSRIRELKVTVDGHSKHIRMIRVCGRPQCYQNDPPDLWQQGTSYSVSIRV
jgi:hypothetical protein